MTDAVETTIDEYLCFAMYSTSLAMTQRYKPLLQALGLTYPQYLVMLVLWKTSGLGIKDIARCLHQDPGSVTPLVKRLESLGLVTRSRHAQDERNLVVSLTAAGDALRIRAREIKGTSMAACQTTEDDARRLVAQLISLRTALEADDVVTGDATGLACER